MRKIRRIFEGTPLNAVLAGLKNRVSDSPDSLIFIHIGKCGGRTLWEAINESPVVRQNFSSVARVHVRKPPIHERSNYLIVVRNPISRALSAFNWRYRIVVEGGEEKGRFRGEYDALVKHRTLNGLAEALYRDSVLNETVAAEFRSIHHLREDIAFYLEDLLNRISDEQVFAVLVTEFLNEEIERALGTASAGRQHENRSRTDGARLVLSERARANLRRFLDPDYRSLERLLAMRKIPPDRYQTLMR